MYSVLKECWTSCILGISRKYLVGLAVKRKLSGDDLSVTDFVGDSYPGPAGPFSLKTVHWTVFRALEPLKGEPRGTLARKPWLPFQGSCQPAG